MGILDFRSRRSARRRGFKALRQQLLREGEREAQLDEARFFYLSTDENTYMGPVVSPDQTRSRPHPDQVWTYHPTRLVNANVSPHEVVHVDCACRAVTCANELCDQSDLALEGQFHPLVRAN